MSEKAVARKPRPDLRLPRSWLLALLVGALVLAHVFVVTAGTFVHWPTYTHFYDLLAEGFRRGQLSLSVTPAPALVQAKDPFSPDHGELWLWDASYHAGKYFIYWGPFPALVLALSKAVLGAHVPVGDQYVTFVAYAAYLAFGALLLERMWRRLFTRIPRAFLWLGVATLALAHPTPFLLASAAVYEAAIASAQACLLAGLVLAFDAVWAAPEGPLPKRALLGAGVCWALALSCRVALGPVVALLACVTAVCVALPRSERRRDASKSLAWLAMPLSIVVLCLLGYNKVRFDDWLEFGIGNQLTTNRFRTAISYVPLNLYSYALRPLDLKCSFPFLEPVRWIGARGFPSWLELQAGYSTWEPLGGYLLTLPLAWLAPLGPLLNLPILASEPRSANGGLLLDGVARGRVFCALCFTLLATVAGISSSGQFLATVRYQGDTSAGVVLLGILGVWSWLWQARNRPFSRRVAATVGTAVSVASIGLGVLLGFQGYSAHFQSFNRPLFDTLSSALSLCQGR